MNHVCNHGVVRAAVPHLMVTLHLVLASCSVQNGSSCHKKDSGNGKSKRTKRRKDSTDSHPRDRVKKSRKKKSKSSKEKSPEVKRSPSPSNTPSEPLPSEPLPSDSEDEEEDYSLCAAPWCREPGGDEVSPQPGPPPEDHRGTMAAQ